MRPYTTSLNLALGKRIQQTVTHRQLSAITVTKGVQLKSEPRKATGLMALHFRTQYFIIYSCDFVCRIWPSSVRRHSWFHETWKTGKTHCSKFLAVFTWLLLCIGLHHKNSLYTNVGILTNKLYFAHCFTRQSDSRLNGNVWQWWFNVTVRWR